MVTFTIALALQGCAYQQAVKHGETAAAADDWGQAYDAYRYANTVKPGKADPLVADARTRAVEAELTEAEAAVTAGDYPLAADHLDRATALDPEHARIAEVRTAASDALHTTLAAKMEAVEDLPETYAFVAMAKELYPRSPEVEDAAIALRQRIATDVEDQLSQLHYAEARAAAELIQQAEPAQRALGQALEAKVTEEWVGHLDVQAEAAERKQPGLAAVYFARAHEVGGDEAWLEASARALEAASAAAAVSVYVDTKGSGGRHYRLRTTLRDGLTEGVGVEAGRSSSWDLMASLSANAERCNEKSETKPIEKEFVAGTRQVPNPEFAEVSEALDGAKSTLAAVDTELGEARSSLGTAKANLESLEAQHGRTQARHDDAAKAVEATQEQITASAQRVEDQKAEIGNIGPANETAIAQAKEQLAMFEGFHAEWKDKLAKDTALVEEIDAALADEAKRLEPLKAEVETLTASVADAESRQGAATTEVADLQGKKGKTPKELTEDVMEIAKVTETTWTTTCEAPATVRYSTRWNTDLDKERTVEASNSMTDVSRPAHEGAKIEADEKAYPKSREELIAELDATTTKAVSDAIEAFVSESFTKTLDEALAETEDVDAAADTLVSVLAGARARVDEERRGKIVEYLKGHYGLEDIAPLDAEAPAEPAPEEAAPTEG